MQNSNGATQLLHQALPRLHTAQHRCMNRNLQLPMPSIVATVAFSAHLLLLLLLLLPPPRAPGRRHVHAGGVCAARRRRLAWPACTQVTE